jgi:DNA polymerase-3 subunit epsilon
MIHSLLNLTRSLFVLDTETTGLDTAKDRIVELAFQQFDATGLVKEWRSLVNPGIPIPASAVKMHRITDEHMTRCRNCGAPKGADHPNTSYIATADGSLNCEAFKPVPTFKQLAANLAKGLVDCDYAGKRVTFDLQILAAEFARAGISWIVGDARIVDADRLEALLNPRSLGHLYKKYTGEDLKDAHGALTDVKATTIVIEHQMSQMIFDRTDGLPHDLNALHTLSFPGFIDLGGKFRMVDGVPCFTQWGKYANKPMTMADVSYWDWVLRESFPADVKRLASAAKLGKFPGDKR